MTARSWGDSAATVGFGASREQFESLVCFLDGTDAVGLSHAELEERVDRDGRELLRRLLDDHLALRAVREQRLEDVVGDEGVVARSGRVRAYPRAWRRCSAWSRSTRLAYRAPGVANLHPADAALNLPIERHSHGLRKLAALEAARGSFQDAVDAIERCTGQRLGKRQVEELATLGAMDFEDFYAARRPKRAQAGSAVGALGRRQGDRDASRRAARQHRHPGRPRRPQAQNPAGGGEKLNHKRMAEIGAVYDATPAPRTPADILARGGRQDNKPPRGRWPPTNG